ncbi:MAG TPA: hypothetical protein VNN73_05730, partial [Blastocatellia bacterium]|nr:hypothetical protein [Blastocatellia bacterium]
MRFKGFLLILMLTILFYEPPAARAQSEDTVRIRTRMVFIDVLVKDKRTGAPVKDLDAENFEVFSDNKRRALTYFTREDSTAKRPLALALVLDLRPGGAGRYLRQPEIVKSLGRAVQKLPPEDEVAVLAVWVNGISGKSEVLTGFTRDRAKVSAALAVVPEIVGAYPKANVNRSECLNDSLDKIIPEVTNLVTPQQYNSHVVIVHISDGLNLLASAQRNQLAAELSKANLTFCALNCNKMKKVQAAIIAFTPLFAMAGIS